MKIGRKTQRVDLPILWYERRKEMNELKKRKDNRLKYYNYSSPGAYFITMCTAGRINLFWNNAPDIQAVCWNPVGANCVRPQNLPLSDIGEIVLKELEEWGRTYEKVSLSSFVVMPNHLHVLVVISEDEYGRPQVAPTIDRMVKQFKGTVTKKVGISIWQKSFHDHIIRSREDYNEHLKYITENPMRWQYDELYGEE